MTGVKTVQLEFANLLDFRGFHWVLLVHVSPEIALITQRSVNENTSPPKKFCQWTWDTCVENFQLVPQKKYGRKTQTKSVKKVRCQDLSRRRCHPRPPTTGGRTLLNSGPKAPTRPFVRLGDLH
jgi:hypothetical protein